MTNFNELASEFWNNHKAIKNAETFKDGVDAELAQYNFVKENIANLNDKDIADTFGKFADFVKKWLNKNPRTITNVFINKEAVSEMENFIKLTIFHTHGVESVWFKREEVEESNSSYIVNKLALLDRVNWCSNKGYPNYVKGAWNFKI